jgi:LmbE family N-acetylglucosaminyl deacetylase
MVESDLRLMVVSAHPDDEAFGSGGTLSKYAAEGCDIYVVMATRGEAGGIAEPDLATPANLPQVRERELRCACEQYGVRPPIFLDYVDGQLPIVNQGQAVGRLVRLIREIKPQVLITFGPDGIYGHYDHIAVHRWATIAVEMAADPECFPDREEGGCETHEVAKVYHTAITAEQVEVMKTNGRAAVMMDGVPFPFVGRREDEITTVIDASQFVEQKRRGILCHVTQVGRDNPFFEGPEGMFNRPEFGREVYVLARSTVSWPEEMEDDLFRGLRHQERRTERRTERR